MNYGFLIALSLVCAGAAQDNKNEAAENKARSVPGAPSKGLIACQQDIERWCKDVKAGESRIGRCLQAHAKELSKNCRRWALHGGRIHMGSSLLEIDKEIKNR